MKKQEGPIEACNQFYNRGNIFVKICRRGSNMIKRILVVVTIFIFCVVEMCFAIYGMCQLYQRPERIRTLEIYKAKVNSAAITVREYERITQALPVLRQLITPLGWLEIEALAEHNRQGKQREEK